MKPRFLTNITNAAILSATGLLAFTNPLRADVTPDEARAIAKEAYIYGYPMVDGYRIQYGFAYAGSRTTGNEAGCILVTGPNWKGEKPQGIKEVIQSETEINVLILPAHLLAGRSCLNGTWIAPKMEMVK